MAGSGFACYDEVFNPKYGEPFVVPLCIANEENLKGYGRKVYDYDKEEVWIVQWPKTGKRPICPGTGVGAGIVEGAFRYEWRDSRLYAENEAVGKVGSGYCMGQLPKDVDPKNRTYVLAREANCHPDGGQVFFPKNKEAFVALLALPGDDVTLEDFQAFYFDGSFGLQIHPDVWHQPLYPMDDKVTFVGKQGAVYACKLVDTVDEFGKWLKIPLKPELAENYQG